MSNAFVLGGGVAGLTAAFELLDRRYRVELLESRSWLGGRAFSFRDRSTRRELDNGPHVMLGCYDRMRALLRRIGTEDEFAAGPTLGLTYRLPGGRVAQLRLGGLPAGLAMPMALWRLPLTFGERARALRGFLSVLRGAGRHWSLRDWIEQRRQRGGPERFFWRPLCLAIMNAEPAEVGADLFLRTLRQAFRGPARRAAIWLPRRPWSEILGGPARRQLIAEGATVTLGARVAGLDVEGDLVTGIRLLDGRRVPVPDGAIVVSGLPWYSLARILGGPAGCEGSPLLSIYFEQDSPSGLPAAETLVCLVDGDPFHYLYRTPGHPAARFALLAGGCTSLAGRTVAEIETIARRQLASYYPEWDPSAVARVRVAKEAKATFVARAAMPRLRPGRHRDMPHNLVACGDWTDTGLPSTLEGAALSAHLALDGIPTAGQILSSRPAAGRRIAN